MSLLPTASIFAMPASMPDAAASGDRPASTTALATALRADSPRCAARMPASGGPARADPRTGVHSIRLHRSYSTATPRGCVTNCIDISFDGRSAIVRCSSVAVSGSAISFAGPLPVASEPLRVASDCLHVASGPYRLCCPRACAVGLRSPGAGPLCLRCAGSVGVRGPGAGPLCLCSASARPCVLRSSGAYLPIYLPLNINNVRFV